MLTRTIITRKYEFAAAHWLPGVPEGHKCHRLHGHSYVCHVSLGGPIAPTGFITDFADLDKHVEPLIALVDHHLLNEVPGLGNPTAELIAAWFFERLQNLDGGYAVTAVRVYEEHHCWAEVQRA